MNNLAVVICTSNNYISFVDNFLYFFRKNIKTNVNTKLYVVGITKNVQIEGVVTIPSFLDENASWSDRVIDGLSQIREKNILFLTEDILFTMKSKSIHTFDDIFNLFISNEFDYLRLSPNPAPTTKLTKLYGEVSPFLIYRISMQPSLWKYDFLMSLIQRNESIWEFEIKGSIRSRKSNKIMALTSYLIPYEEVIAGGKITRKGYYLLKQERLDIKGFQVKSIGEELKRFAHKLLLFPISKINFFKKYSGI